MLAKLKAGILTLFLLVGMLAGAGVVTAESFALTVNVKDTAYGAVAASGLTVKIYNADGTLNQQLTGYNPAYFALEKAIYKVEASKEGYKSATWNVNMFDGAQTVNLFMEKLPTQPSQPSGSTGGTSQGGTTTTQTSNTLIITDVDYKDEVKPGESVTFDVDVKNDVSYDADNVEITVTIKDIDDGDDIDVTEDFSTLDKGDKDTYTLKLDIPKEVDAKKYDLEVKVEWEDADGKDYSNTKSYDDAIEVVKENHDVQIVSTSFLATSMDAGKSNQATVSLWYAGKNDETVRIKVEIPDLKVSAMSAQFDLDENDEGTQYIPFTIPADAKAGKYFAYVTVYFNSGTSSNMEMSTLEVKAPATQTSSAVSVTPVVVTTQTQPEAEGGFGTAGIVAGIVIALLVIGMLVKEFSPQFLPRPTVIKAARGGR